MNTIFSDTVKQLYFWGIFEKLVETLHVLSVRMNGNDEQAQAYFIATELYLSSDVYLLPLDDDDLEKALKEVLADDFAELVMSKYRKRVAEYFDNQSRWLKKAAEQ